MALVVLVQPPIADFYLTKKRTIPYGLLSMAANLKAHGYDAKILDSLATDKAKPLALPEDFAYLTPFYGRPDQSLFSLFHRFRHFGYSFEHIAHTVQKLKPFLVGISSLFSPYHATAMATAAAIRKWNPDIPIVMGGHHPTLFPEAVIASPSVDYVLRGEGEETLPLLCRALEDGTPMDQIPGIAFQDAGKIKINPPHWTADLSRLPLPDQKNQGYYRRKNQDALVIVASRGCPMPCSYCSVSATSAHGKFRRRPVSHVLQEIQNQAARQDIGFIDFEDENLSLDKPWFMALLAGIRKIFSGKNVELRAMNGLYPLSLDEEIITAMADTGFATLNLSLGSASKKQLERFRRPDVRAAHDQAVSLARQKNLSCVSYVIAGAPDQTAQDSLNDLLYLATRPTLAGLSIFYPAPGSRDFDRCRTLSILPENFSLMRATAFPLDHTTSRLQSVTLLRLCRILNYMKHLADKGSALPVPRPPPGRGSLFDPASGRVSISEQLLQWFLYDAAIRGVDKTGQVYVHKTDPGLCQAFTAAVQSHPPAGLKTEGGQPAGNRLKIIGSQTFIPVFGHQDGLFKLG
ncbi:MAG: B12-binding domain-containing radical SAM protein [Desulfotignum sp.]|nr:B12-binding domain-containing radical SAM protein [Desulfotignum sp.]MCF8113797.1 B12-binding domain-containing radical SAM protein [Desulfotignum sp.]MCF8125411.1 B12-binding domain-containing radical SAM protein [Desulfotignum sp.]